VIVKMLVVEVQMSHYERAHDLFVEKLF
jgi:hypothetical protein